MPFFTHPLTQPSPLRAAIIDAYHMDETLCMEKLLNTIDFSNTMENNIAKTAAQLIEGVRAQTAKQGGMQAFMQHYDLSTEEGILLMCLAEALLRVPDKKTEKLLVSDKLSSADWKKHLGESESKFVNFATWGLNLGGKLLDRKGKTSRFKALWKGLLQRSGEPVVLQAVREAIKVMSQNFVLGRDIEEALKRSQQKKEQGYLYSYDMLGEAARTQIDADAYFTSYQYAIDQIAKHLVQEKVTQRASISVKLSALHPRYEFAKQEICVPALTERLKSLATQAKNAGMSLTVDAEETDRLDMSLDIIQAVFSDPDLDDWEGLGLALQAYQKRAFYVIDWLIDLAKKNNKRIQVRLVKGAYWDSEIKIAQEGGFNHYPVFTRKVSTDVSYLACAKKILAAQEAIYPQFASHNAYTVAAILEMVKAIPNAQYEFQSLQGMGNDLHEQMAEGHDRVPCRIYAPVGSHENLLPYLVRRLLENGANSSFVNKISNKSVPISELIENPIEKIKSFDEIPHPKIPLPQHIYGATRLNSSGIDVSDYGQLQSLEQAMQAGLKKEWKFKSSQKHLKGGALVLTNPSDGNEVVGVIEQASREDVETVLQQAQASFYNWDQLGPEIRADFLDSMANILEKNAPELMSIMMREAGKVLNDVISEVREAVDFCRYYAQIARETLMAKTMPGPTGESNILYSQGRGVMLCISPWNFPVAIFTGQVAAALVAGNCVIAKPAEQTPVVATRVVELFHQAGIPKQVLQLLPGPGETIGAALVEDERIAGILFTGSTDTAKIIQQSLAQRKGPIVPFIAETGGINAMIVDSTALPEQVVRDVVASAFGSAGQRCSALRLLLVQADVANSVIEMLQGAMKEISVGDPLMLATDVGPVIDEEAQQKLFEYSQTLKQTAQLIYEVPLSKIADKGTYVSPIAFELESITQLSCEMFGPILHVVRYARRDLDQVIQQVNDLGYGLTFGIQSRIDQSVDYIKERIQAGNIYVNRNMIGAVVGVQPFGGSRLSGTGPKAGGPHYLTRLCHECTVSIDTTAAGGNASLMELED